MTYTEWSKVPHEPLSEGPLRLPYMRPPQHERTFESQAMETLIQDMTERMVDKDLARLFENAFSCTLDTTVRHLSEVGFIVTGDISAHWIRDTANQFAHLYPLLPLDAELRRLVKAIIHTQSIYLSRYPYANAFQPLPETGMQPAFNGHAVKVLVEPPVDDSFVYEAKYELDTLAGFLKCANRYYEYTQDGSFMDTTFFAAIDQIFRVMEEQTQSSFDVAGHFCSPFRWTGTPGALQGPVKNEGHGHPRKHTGLVACSHRPSDDGTMLPFLIPANAMLCVELERASTLFPAPYSTKAADWAKSIRAAVWAQVGDVFPYEVDGFGSRLMMDDANVPSLLSLPYIGFLSRTDATYQRTRKMLWSPQNPYFSSSPHRHWCGIGGPHISVCDPWPMSHVSAIFGTDDDEVIKDMLNMLLHNTSGLGLIHEAVNIYDEQRYTRPWFAWANSYFAECLMDLAQRKPHLIFKDSEPYSIMK